MDRITSKGGKGDLKDARSCVNLQQKKKKPPNAFSESRLMSDPRLIAVLYPSSLVCVIYNLMSRSSTNLTSLPRDKYLFKFIFFIIGVDLPRRRLRIIIEAFAFLCLTSENNMLPLLWTQKPKQKNATLNISGLLFTPHDQTLSGSSLLVLLFSFLFYVYGCCLGDCVCSNTWRAEGGLETLELDSIVSPDVGPGN